MSCHEIKMALRFHDRSITCSAMNHKAHPHSPRLFTAFRAVGVHQTALCWREGGRKAPGVEYISSHGGRKKWRTQCPRTPAHPPHKTHSGKKTVFTAGRKQIIVQLRFCGGMRRTTINRPGVWSFDYKNFDSVENVVQDLWYLNFCLGTAQRAWEGKKMNISQPTQNYIYLSLQH